MSDDTERVGRVLILEAGAENGDLLGAALSNDSRVKVVNDAFDVLDVARVDPPDMIIVDASSGANAPELCRTLGADRFVRRIPILMVAEDEAIRVSAYEAGAFDAVSPDISPALLRNKVARLVRQKRAEEQLVHAEICARQKAEELESVIEMVAHDLKSPVVAVAGFVRMLHRRLAARKAESAVNEILNHVAVACETMLAMLKDLSEVLRADKVDHECGPVPLVEIIEEVVERHRELINQREVSVTLDLGDDACFVIGDRRRLAQVFTNLLMNALLHMGNPPSPRIRITVERARDLTVARVSDNGAGIPPEFLDRVFDRFFRVPGTQQKSGTGLGLAIAKAIVESNGGQIWAESRINHGTTFSFTMPRCMGESAVPGRCVPPTI